MKLWEANIRKVVPYTPGEQPNESGMIKLNTNENPYSPAPGVEKALKALDADTLRLYPDPTAGDLVHSIAAFYGLKDEQVFTGVGSDDVLAMCFLTFFNSEKPILFPDITYSFYDVWADLLRIPYERPALDEEFHIRKEDYFRENGGIVFPNPNAPTGVEMPLSEIEEIVANIPLTPIPWIVLPSRLVWHLWRIRHILRNAAIRSLQQESGQRQSSGSLDFPSRIPDPTLSLPHMRAVRPKSFSQH